MQPISTTSLFRGARFGVPVQARGASVLLAMLAAPLVALVLTTPAHAQAAQTAQPSMETAQISRLVPGLAFPPGAFRSTNKNEIDTLSTALVKFTKQEGLESEDAPAPTKVEVVIWKTDSKTLYMDVLEALKKANYVRGLGWYDEKKGEVTVQPFNVFPTDNHKEYLSGMW